MYIKFKDALDLWFKMDLLDAWMRLYIKKDVGPSTQGAVKHELLRMWLVCRTVGLKVCLTACESKCLKYFKIV